MTRNQHLRRIIILCCHCLRNFAFYKSGWENGKPILQAQFWLNANNNFLDIGIMEWCKLFADKRGKHHWGKIISDKEMFYNGLLKHINEPEETFTQYIDSIKTYRDKFIAHLDKENTAHIPIIKSAEESTIFLYNYIMTHEDKDYCIPEAPSNPEEFYKSYFEEGKLVVQNHRKIT